MRRLTPGEIRRFRELLGKTQEEMSELLGIGKKTYTRWESGAYPQTESSDRYLRLVMFRRENLRFLERHNAKVEAWKTR